MSEANLETATEVELVTADEARVPEGIAERLREFLRHWHDRLDRAWRAEDVPALHEQLESLATEAEGQGRGDIAGPGLELTVYLCAFADGAAIPNARQRAEIDAMLARLHRASSELPTVIEAGAPRVVPCLYHLRPRDGELHGLAGQLGGQGYAVRMFECCADVEHALGELVPDALVLDAAFVPELHGLLERAARSFERKPKRVACLVLGTSDEQGQRLAALRAGADAFIACADAIAVGTRIAELLAEQRQQHYRVLIVEDDRSQAMICDASLRHRGMETEICLRAQDVPAAAARFRPDLVLLDLHLPDGDGIELAQQLRESPDGLFVPIVFLSGEQDVERRYDAIRLGGDDFLNKPIKPRHLVSMVESRVRRARLLKAGAEDTPARERRGAMVGRDALMREIGRAGAAGAHALVLVGVDREQSVRESIGFAAAGQLARQIGVELARDDLLRPLCAAGEFSFLGIARAGDAKRLGSSLQELRDALATRGWLDVQRPERLEFTIVAAPIPPAVQPDELVHALRTRLASAQTAGGGRLDYPEASPTSSSCPSGVDRAAAHAALRAASLPGVILVEFQPLLPLKGELSDRFRARYSLRLPGSSRAPVRAEAFMPLARELGTLQRIERQLLKEALAAIANHQRAETPLRLHVPLSADALIDADLASWLGAALADSGVPAGSLVLMLERTELGDDVWQHRAALEALQMLGVKLSVRGVTGSVQDQHWLRMPALDLVAVSPPPSSRAQDWPRERGGAIRTAIEHGKLVIAESVADTAELSELMRLGVHYAESEALSSWCGNPHDDG